MLLIANDVRTSYGWKYSKDEDIENEEPKEDTDIIEALRDKLYKLSNIFIHSQEEHELDHALYD